MCQLKPKSDIFSRSSQPDIRPLRIFPQPHVMTFLNSIQALLIYEIGPCSV